MRRCGRSGRQWRIFSRRWVADTHGDLVEISELHFAYGEVPILRGLSLRIPRGKVVAILGGSGSGKSTLLKLIGGQLAPQRGWIQVDGKVVHKLATDDLYALRRKMGMMFQSSGLFTDLTVYENIAFAIREHYDLPEELVRALVLMKLDAVGLRGARDMMPGDLSGGMTRRVALARAIATDPLLVMYDEPFAGLDPISLNVIATLIRKLNDALGLTSIVVTYDVSESLKLVDYIYVIAEGRLMGEGTPQELLASEDPYLKQFLKALPDGPVRFHVPAKPLAEELRLTPSLPSG
jgi:phospholipid/cholesterol/gamma-HCH transport system ATP-binding protein